jgi:hypothetical protein
MIDNGQQPTDAKKQNRPIMHHSQQQTHRLPHKPQLYNAPANTPIAQIIKQLEITLAFFDKKTEFFFACCHFL